MSFLAPKTEVCQLLRLVGAVMLEEEDGWAHNRVFSPGSAARACEAPGAPAPDGALARAITEPPSCGYQTSGTRVLTPGSLCLSASLRLPEGPPKLDGTLPVGRHPPRRD